MHGIYSAEILFNRVYNVTNIGNYGGDATAVDVNQDSMANNIHLYRNTFVGRVQVRKADSNDGPFIFSNNVIINNDPGNHIYYEKVSDSSRIIVTNNLVGAPSQNIVDQDLNLTSAFAAHVGTHGHQLSKSSAPRVFP